MGEVPYPFVILIHDPNILQIPFGVQPGIVVANADGGDLTQIPGLNQEEGAFSALLKCFTHIHKFIFAACAQGAVEGDVYPGHGGRSVKIAGSDPNGVGYSLAALRYRLQISLDDTAVLIPGQPAEARELPAFPAHHVFNFNGIQEPTGQGPVIVVADGDAGQLAKLLRRCHTVDAELVPLKIIFRTLQLEFLAAAQGAVEGDKNIRIGARVQPVAGFDAHGIGRCLSGSRACHQNRCAGISMLRIVEP